MRGQRTQKIDPLEKYKQLFARTEIQTPATQSKPVIVSSTPLSTKVVISKGVDQKLALPTRTKTTEARPLEGSASTSTRADEIDAQVTAPRMENRSENAQLEFYKNMCSQMYCDLEQTTSTLREAVASNATLAALNVEKERQLRLLESPQNTQNMARPSVPPPPSQTPPNENDVSQNKNNNLNFNQNNSRNANRSSDSVDSSHNSESYQNNFMHETQQRQLEMNQTLSKIYQLQKEEFGKTPVQFNYQLNQKTEYRVWYDFLVLELKSQKLLDVIDLSINPIKDYTRDERWYREGLVRGIIISRLDEYNHKLIINIQEPLRMLKLLKDTRRMQKNVTHTTIRQRLNAMRMSKKEKVADFLVRFDNVLREYEATEPGTSIQEDELRSILFSAVREGFPAIINPWTNYQVEHDCEMSYQKLRDALFKVERIRNQQSDSKIQNAGQGSASRRPAANAASLQDRRGRDDNNADQNTNAESQIKCHRCYGWGHKKPDCPLKETNLWFCGGCNRIASHIRKDCKHPTQQAIENQKGQ